MTFLHSDAENIRSSENLPVTVHSGAGEASVLIAEEIATLIKQKEKSNDHCVLGLPTGSTPVGVYDELVRMYNEEGLSFRNVVTFNLDEYYPMQPHKLQSYVRFMREHLLDQVDLKPGNINIPDGTIPVEEVPEFCRKYEEKVNKPILKLTNRDYNDNGMGNLVATKGSAYDINIRVFNQIQHTITGWPGGKPNADDSDRPERSEPFPKRVIIFSPHPDDDVISMGGTFIRLVDQGHDVHVGYQTSGNIAVFDEDVIRFSDFVREFESDFFGDSTVSEGLHKELVEFLGKKRPGQVDAADDEREFWQRAEDRNRETAQLFDKLGMAEYEAIEAFVRYIP